MESPSRIAQRFLSALDSGEWRTAAELIWPLQRERFLRSAPGMAEPVEPLTVERYLERDPNAPREVAEYIVERSGRVKRTVGPPFPGISSPEELRALDPLEAVALHLQATEHRELARRHHEALIETYPEHEEALRERLRKLLDNRRMVIGEVVEGDRAFVLYGLSDDEGLPDEIAPSPSVLRLVRDGEEWVVNHQVHGLIVAGLGSVRITGPDGETVLLGL